MFQCYPERSCLRVFCFFPATQTTNLTSHSPYLPKTLRNCSRRNGNIAFARNWNSQMKGRVRLARYYKSSKNCDRCHERLSMLAHNARKSMSNRCQNSNKHQSMTTQWCAAVALLSQQIDLCLNPQAEQGVGEDGEEKLGKHTNRDDTGVCNTKEEQLTDEDAIEEERNQSRGTDQGPNVNPMAAFLPVRMNKLSNSPAILVMDASATGEKYMELLCEIAKSYSCRVNPYHSLLRERYGLYGSPLEPDLFDIDPPLLRTAPATNTTYSGVVASTVGPTTGGVSAGGIPLTAGSGLANVTAGSGANCSLAFSDEVLFKDLMNLCHMDKNLSGPSGVLNIGSTSRCGAEQPLSRYLTGLLEVEPLHFTCHATSDGTRMERLDTLNQTTALPGNAVGLSGTINFAEGLSSTTGTMLSTLSSAMVSAEQQLVQLQQKQLQLIKLQQQKQKLEQKLAETTKNVASGAAVGLPSHYMSYGSELFPPTPKNTPFFMTPPVTPPNESYHGMFMGGVGGTSGLAFGNDKDADKPPSGKPNNSSKALGQRSLTGPAASSILENILLLLARQLSPLSSDVNDPWRNNLRHLDLTLIGWLLLFLSKCLDCCQSNASDDMNKAPSKDKEGRWCFPGAVSSRWNFIQGENAVQANKLSKSNTSKLYRRKLQKRLLHHKQQLMNLQQAKKHFSSKMEESVAAGSLMDKETEHLVKTQDMLFKRQMRQYSSKHLKDIINIRRTDGEMLRKQANKEGGGSQQTGERDSWESDIDSSLLVMSREKCIPVVHGLVTLLLSMDFTCHVDLFIIACKVLARVTVSTRPAISLSEAMKQEDLEQLMLLMCNIEYNHGNVSWGGSWSGHSITCLLQDILEGERLYSVASQLDGNTDGELLTPMGAGAAADAASNDITDSLLHSCTLPTMDEEPAINDSSAKNKYDMDVSMLVDALMDDELYEEQMSGKYTDLKDFLYTEAIRSDWTAKLMNVTMKSNPNSSTIHWGFTGNPVFGDDDKKDIKLWKSKNASFNRPMNAAPQGVSLAMDARLEQGVELRAELRLKLMLSMEANNIQNAMNAPLPLLTLGSIPKTTTSVATAYTDDRLSEDSFLSLTNRMETSSSLTMLSTCFNHLFSQLHLRRINLDVLLQIWLTLNDESASEDNGGPTFDPSRVPIISLDQSAVSSLLAALAWSPSVSARTWVLAFQTLTLMANIKYSNDDGLAQGGAAAESANTASHLAEKWLASFIITDNNLMTVLVKFLSGSGQQTSVTQAVQNAHNADFESVITPRKVIDTSDDLEPPEVQEEPEKIQLLQPEPLQPQEELLRYSGGGILGLALMALLPAVALSLGLSCSLRSCNVSRYPRIPSNLSAYLDTEVAMVLAGWLAFQFIVALIPVGGIRLGQPLQPDGKRLKYRCNGLFSLVVNGLAIGLLFYYKYPVNNWLSRKFLPLTVTASLFALFFSIWAFLRARSLPKEQLSYFGQTGNFFNDFYMGRELNLRIRGVDLKLFFIVNVGLIGWATFESFTLIEAFQNDLWTGAMLLVAGFQSVYLLDALLFQVSIAHCRMHSVF